MIPSGEVLARVLPQLAMQLHAASIADPDLGRLYGALYAAFRQRRSLLLLNLEHQVRLDELPWIAAINAFRADELRVHERSRHMLQQIVALALAAFPQQILPNKLLQEIRALAEPRPPIVDEVAADIFMGDFSEKYLRAAQRASTLLTGTLYARYYGIDYDEIQQIDDVTPSHYGTPTSAAFTRLCYQRAGVTQADGRRSVARNGMVIEQEQILTTHNLAVLMQALGLIDVLEPQLEELARRCFVWICQRQQQKITAWQPRLRMIKNCAYAWRQMIFFLALLPDETVRTSLTWADAHLRQQRPAFQARFRGAIEGLALAAGASLTASELRTPAAAPHRFLGWASERHWLLADQ